MRICAGWYEALLVAHASSLEISCTGSILNHHVSPTYGSVRHMAQEKLSAIWKDELNNSANCESRTSNPLIPSLPLSHCIQDKNRINNQHTGLSEYVYSIKNNLGIGLSNQNRSTIIHIFIFNSLLASGNLIWVQTVCKAYQQKVSPDLDPNHLTLWFELDLFFLWPFCKIWMKLLNPFKSHWSETTIWGGGQGGRGYGDRGCGIGGRGCGIGGRGGGKRE